MNCCNANETYYDNVGLFKEDYGQSYSYDSKGNVISSQDMAKQKTTLQYDGNDNLIKSIDPKGGNIAYTYDTVYKHRLTKAVSSIGLTYNMSYNNYRTSNKCKNNRNGNNKIYR